MRNRYTVLVACAMTMLSTGMNYVWSILQVPAMEYYGVGAVAASRVFYLFLTFNVIGIFIGGRVYDRVGPRIPVLIGTCLYITGLFASSLVPKDNFLLLYITYSGLLSLGGGIVYPCTISCAQQWWPDKKGFASGVVLSMLGASTLVLTPVINALIADNPSRVPYSFRVLGIGFSIVLLAAYSFIRLPATETDVEKTPRDTSRNKSVVVEILKSKAYYMLLFCIAVGPIGYFTVNPHAKILGMERSLSDSLILSMIMGSGAASAVGRLVFGKLCDNIGARNVFSILFCITMVCSLGLSFAGGVWFFILVILLSCAFGGFAGITPSLGVDYFGGENIGTVISMFSIAILVSSFASPVIVSVFATPEGNLTIWNFIICAILALTGLIVTRLNRNDEGIRVKDMQLDSGPTLYG